MNYFTHHCYHRDGQTVHWLRRIDYHPPEVFFDASTATSAICINYVSTHLASQLRRSFASFCINTRDNAHLGLACQAFTSARTTCQSSVPATCQTLHAMLLFCNDFSSLRVWFKQLWRTKTKEGFKVCWRCRNIKETKKIKKVRPGKLKI